jgi:ABC-type microcin C transport system permease subunit YejE
MTDQELDKALQERLKQLEGNAPRNWIIVGSYVFLAVMLTICLFVVAAFT